MTTYTRAASLQIAAPNQPIRSVLCTSAMQADGYALSMAGAKLDRYRANPAILVNHRADELPIGRVEDIRVGPASMTGELRFGSDPAAQLVESRIREGIVNAVSIRFEPHKVDRGGNVSSWSLLEVSAVSIPMDSSAMVYSRTVGRTVDRSAARRLLAAIDQTARTTRADPQRAKRRIVADDIELLDLLDQALQNPSGGSNKINLNDDNVNTEKDLGRPSGNSESAALRRLRKDRPDLHAEVLAERLSAHAAMVKAGFRRRTQTIRMDSPESAAQTLRKHMPLEARQALARLLLED